MDYTLGLDIGSNSIGWSVLEDREIIDMGVRIFPVGVKEDDYNKSGKEESKNATRRTARGIRRLYDRYKLRRKQLRKLLLSLDMLPPEIHLTARQIYGLRAKALDQQITKQELGRIFLLLNQRRGFKSNKKDKGGAETAKELSEIKEKMAQLDQLIHDLGFRTVGEYFYSLFQKQDEISDWRNTDEPVERIRNRFVFRKTYEHEFDLIWKKQQEYYPEILTDSNYKKIKENCIYYQRPLKSQKGLVSKCRFEPKKRVAPKSSFAFQEFRIWQFINNLRITGGDRFRDVLTLDEKNRLAEAFAYEHELTVTKMKSALNFPKSYTFQADLPQRLKGNTTNAKLATALGSDYYKALSDEQRYRLWHTLYFANDEEWLEEHAQKKLNLSPEQTAQYLKISLEEEYGNLSGKAINKILPFMKAGFDYPQACEEAGYHHSFDEETDGSERELKEFIERDKEDELRNPLVQQAVNETIRLVNALIVEYGKPKAIRVEFARALKKSKEKREKITKKLQEKEEVRHSYREFLKNRLHKENISNSELLKFELWLEMAYNEKELQNISGSIDLAEFRKFSKNVKPGDTQKYALWLECGRVSPYSGKVINLHRLFSADIEIEHIIPYSRCLDDSFMNKTLCERELNLEKNNQTPFEYFSGQPQQWSEFCRRISHFSDGKQAKFMTKEIPSDFISQQLNNTAYIAKQARKKLKTVCRDVTVTNGQATSKLRHLWGLNTILNPKGENEKSRHDHRHHAVDALVIAATTPYYIRVLSDHAKFDGLGKLTLKEVPPPYTGFRDAAKGKIETILISYRNKKRLITTKANKYVHSRSDKTQQAISIRGPLHEDTFYGRIYNPHKENEETYVIRKSITSIKNEKQIEKIIDPAIRELIRRHIADFGGKVKEAMAAGVFMISKDGKKKIPVKKVRMEENAEELIQLRPKENPKLFVASGNNYLMAIYEKDGERAFENVSYYKAVQKRINGQLIFPLKKSELPLLLTIKQRDLIITYEKTPEEIDWGNQKQLFNSLYLIRVLDKNGTIRSVKHNIAGVDPGRTKGLPREWFYNKNHNTFRAIKVRISITGKIVKI